VTFQILKHFLLWLRLGKIGFGSTLGHFTEGPNDMRELQHEPPVEVRKDQEVAKLCQGH
jgi:hypothetical protein